jgi:hypothetical protein
VIDTVALTVKLSAFVTEFDFASVTLTVKLLVPVAVGVPLIVPALDSDNPDGKLPELSDQV